MYTYPREYEIIVVGGGHAGCEAALAAARMGCRTLLLTMNLETIAQMSCNPAIGGLAKGHLVKELDALGGEMGAITDQTGVQFRVLNTGKGPAVRALRAQADRVAYRLAMRYSLERQSGIEIKQGKVIEILVSGGRVLGVSTEAELAFRAEAVVLAAGTFLNGMIHIGDIAYPAGRASEFPALFVTESLKRNGFDAKRLSTSTPPRIAGQTVDLDRLDPQWGDDPPPFFSWRTKKISQEQLPCYLTFTNHRTHEIIRGALNRSPLFHSQIAGVGPRYCPSIEEKVANFPHRQRHQIFLEPEGRGTDEMYVNGFFTGLPVEIQVAILRTLPGMEKVEVTRPGYAIEYDYFPPVQLHPTLETRLVRNLYFAGQINGTSGYEEAAVQGLMAGINAALKLKGRPPFVLKRWEAYIGVLIDDLVTKGTNEPYRMFTSRAEHRLLLRQDNAIKRLMSYGRKFDLIPDDVYRREDKKGKKVNSEIKRLKKITVSSKRANQVLLKVAERPTKKPTSLAELLRRPNVTYGDLADIDATASHMAGDISSRAEIEVKYEGYIRRQEALVERICRLEQMSFPDDFDFLSVRGLSREAASKLAQMRPLSIGQASRISGVSPSDISLLMVHLERRRRCFT